MKLKKSAAKEIAKLDTVVAKRLLVRIYLLAHDPYLAAPAALVGQSDTYRLRVGNYRVIYTVLDDELIVHVIKVGHRSDIYRKR